MDTKVTFHQDQALLHTDFNTMQGYASSALDLAIKETIGEGSWYARMTTTRTDTWEITTTAGALYIDGARFRLASSVVTDLFNYRPVTHKKIVAVIGTPLERDGDPEQRLVATDAEGTTWEPQPLSMAHERYARVEIVAGVEGAVPNAPAVPSGSVLIAHVTLTTSGISTSQMWADTEVPQALRNQLLIAELSAFQTGVGQAIDTIRTDMAALGSRLGGYVSQSMFAGHLAEFEQVKADAAKALDLAMSAEFLMQDVDGFSSDTLSDDAYSGYSARIDRGLRFAFDASDDATLELLNPYDDKLTVKNNFALPTFTEVARLSTYSPQYTAESLNAYTNVTITKRTGNRPVWNTGVGAEYVVRQTHKFTGTNVAAPTTITHGGVTYTLVDNEVESYQGAPGEDGGLWATSVLTYQSFQQQISGYESYTYDDVNEAELTSQGRAQTWVQSQAGWLTSVDLFIDAVGAGNDLRVMIAEASGGDPDIKRIMAEVTVPYANLVAAGATASGGMRVSLDPTLLSAGKRYALILLSQGNHTIRISSDKQAEVNGDFYYLGSTGAWVKATTSQQMQMRLVFAKFASTRVAVDMEPLELTGGINSVNIFTEVVQPSPTKLDYEVQIGGVWYVLGSEVGARLAADLSAAGSLLPLRVVFVGTVDLMPGVGLTATKSAIKTSRAATTITHVSALRDLGSGVTAETLRVRVRAENWDDAKHAITIALINGSDSVIAADGTEKTLRDADTVEYVATFTLDPTLQTFRYKITGTTSDIEDQFYVAERQASIYAASA